MIIDPRLICAKGCIEMSVYSKIQQSGIDVSIKSIKQVLAVNEKNEICYAPPLEAPYHLHKDCFEIECNEIVQVPSNAIMLLIIRSSWNRRGAFITTGVYDNGFNGRIGGMLHVSIPLTIQANERIGQVVFIKSEGKDLYEGCYQSTKAKAITV